MAENYNGMAVGVFELDNLVACFVALDAASKAANVKIQSVERNRLKSGACVKMRGMKFEQFPDTLFPVHLATVFGLQAFWSI